MSIPKVAGIETEFAISGDDPVCASEDVLLAYPNVFLSAESERSNPCVSSARGLDLMLSNGARFYVDHAHPEFSTAESTDARVVVALERAGASIVQRCAESATKARKRRVPIRVYKNNSDHKGNSYGCHENYLLDAATYNALFGHRAHWLFTYLIPFLVSRIVISGAGKVGAENGTDAVTFQISQRADFFEELVGLQTTHNRPIVNTRDEPHADSARFRRLHVISGDANMCPYAAWLKVGTMQLLLRMLEDGALHGRSLILADPLSAIRTYSRSTDCRTAVLLEDGRRLTAIEMQMEFLDLAISYLACRSASQEEKLILDHWEATLLSLRQEPDELLGRIDWVTKRRVLTDLGANQHWGWESPQALEADIKYHALDPAESLFLILERTDVIVFPPGWPDVAESFYEQNPPADSRAFTRGRLIERFAPEIQSVDWEEVVFRKGSVKLPSPADMSQERVGHLLGDLTNVNELMDAFQKIADYGERVR